MKLRTILIIIILVLSIFTLAIIYLNNFSLKHSCNELALPGGYTCTNFAVVKVLEGTKCNTYTDCASKLPMEYAVMSSCPYQAICLSEKCTVVCPSYKT